MSQVTSGLYRLVGVPAVYRWLQASLAGSNAIKNVAATIIRARPGERVLDLGCGSAAILEFLPQVSYVGVDANPRHVEAARAKYGERGTFLVGDAANARDVGTGFDLVLMLGLLHHLGDTEAHSSIDLAADLLRPGGRLLTLDPCWCAGQHRIARFLIGRDSGRMVRDEAGYVALAKRRFARVDASVRHDLLRVPYTHCIVDATDPQQ